MHYREAMAEIEVGKIRPIYLVYGEESFLKEQVFHALRSAIVRPETADFNCHVLEAGPDQAARALALAQTQPFFAERRLVVVKDCPAITPSRRKQSEAGEEEGEKPAGEGDEALVQYAKSPVPSATLLFLADSVDSRRRTTRALLASGGAVECQPLKPEDAVMWVQTRAQSKGKRLGEAAAQLLVEKIGPDLGLLEGELTKLCLYAGEGREIAAADVHSVVANLAETEVYKLTEAVMLKQRARALALLERLLRQVDHPLQLLAALTNKYRQILLVKALAERRVSPAEGAALAKMRPYAYTKMVDHVKGLGRDEVVRAMYRMLEADLAMKSGFDPRLTIETLVVQLLEESA